MINWKPIETLQDLTKPIIATNGKTIAEVYWVINPARTWQGINIPQTSYWELAETADLEGNAIYYPTHWDDKPELPKNEETT